MRTELRQGEQIVREGGANLQKNVESVGGRLFLTGQRLIFEAHKINVQGGTTEVSLSNVVSTRACWTRFLGMIPLFPNSLAVFTKDGKEYRFVLFGRHEWAAAIEAQGAGYPCLASTGMDSTMSDPVSREDRLGGAKKRAGEAYKATVQGLKSAKRSAELVIESRRLRGERQKVSERLEMAYEVLGEKAEQGGLGGELPTAAAVSALRTDLKAAENVAKTTEARLAETQGALDAAEREHAPKVAELQRVFDTVATRLREQVAAGKALEAESAKIQKQMQETDTGADAQGAPSRAELERSAADIVPRLAAAKKAAQESHAVGLEHKSALDSAKSTWESLRSDLAAKVAKAKTAYEQASRSVQAIRLRMPEAFRALGRALAEAGPAPAQLAEERAAIDRLIVEGTKIDTTLAAQQEESESLRSGTRGFLLKAGIAAAVLVVVLFVAASIFGSSGSAAIKAVRNGRFALVSPDKTVSEYLTKSGTTVAWEAVQTGKNQYTVSAKVHKKRGENVRCPDQFNFLVNPATGQFALASATYFDLNGQVQSSIDEALLFYADGQADWTKF